jgi:hypothetical protein
MGVAWNEVALTRPDPSETSPVLYSHALRKCATLSVVICFASE